MKRQALVREQREKLSVQVCGAGARSDSPGDRAVAEIIRAINFVKGGHVTPMLGRRRDEGCEE